MATTIQSVTPQWLEIARQLAARSRWAIEEGPVEMRQTHISTVLLGRDHVLKLKKPVDFGFLDYTTLEKRRNCCHAEVRLNRRLCPDIYLGVAEVVAGNGTAQLRLGPEGSGLPILDYGVWMKRLPDAGMLDRMVADGTVTEHVIDRVAERLSRFHVEARSDGDTDVWGSPAEVAHNWRENFEQEQPFAGQTIDTADLDTLRLWVDGWIAANTPLLEKRVREGFVIDGHGDVRCESICVNGGIHIFDCIEFNDRFRCGDTASEVAFLAMDLHALGRPDLSYYFIERYAEHSGDHGLWKLQPFYLCYRAFVRGKVASFVAAEREFTHAQARSAADRAGRLFALALRYARPLAAPTVVAVSGLSGTGKTSIARALATETGLRVHSSDAVRKALFGSDKHPDAYRAGAYSGEATRATYQRLLDEGAHELARGAAGVVLDATFLAERDIAAARAMAEAAGARFRRIECRLEPDLVKVRLAGRAERHEGLSDANWDVYLHQKERPQPAVDAATFVLDTAGPLAESAASAVAWLREQESIERARAGLL